MFEKRKFPSEKLAYFGMIVLVLGIAVLSLGYFADNENGAVSKTEIKSGGSTLLKSTDGNVVVVIPANAVPDASGLYVIKIGEDLSGTDYRISDVYKFGPSGTVFEQPVEVRMKYLPEAGCPQKLWFYHFGDNGSLKEAVPHKKILCSINSASFEIKSFSTGYVSTSPRGRGN